MRFPGFYGNHALRNRLSGTLSGGGLSHFYILSGPAGSGKKTLGKILAAAYQCTGSGDKPCGECPHCKKIFGGGHPDVITVDSDKATIPVKLIRDYLQPDVYIRPNEGKRKVYLIPRAQAMLDPAQNALLKLLEEPPSYCAFILMTDNPEKILTTIRSRAVELSLFPLSDLDLKNALLQLRPQADPQVLASAAERSGGYLGTALELVEQNTSPVREPLRKFLKAYVTGNEPNILVALAPLEKLSRQEQMELFTQLHLIFTRALSHQAGAGSLFSKEAEYLSAKCTPQQLYTGVDAMKTVLTLLASNSSPGHCVGMLMALLT